MIGWGVLVADSSNRLSELGNKVGIAPAWVR